MSFIFNNQDSSLNGSRGVHFFRFTRGLVTFGVALTMLLSTGASLTMGGSEVEGSVKESPEEKVDSGEIFARHSKPQKIQPCFATTCPVATPPKYCYQHIGFVQGHQLKNGLVAPLLC